MSRTALKQPALGALSLARARARAPKALGFTLVEVIVALSAGLLVAGSAYALARNSMKSFQDESRIATSQVAASAGLNRLTADLQRAGFMASPNFAADPRRCISNQDVANTPVFAVDISTAAAALPGAFGYGGVNVLAQPDVIVVTGNMTSTEQFEYRAIDFDGTDVKAYLAMDRGPMVRLLADTGNVVDAVRGVFIALDGAGAFVNGRLARIVDQSGKESYVIVNAVAVAVDTAVPPNITDVALTLETVAGTATAPTNPAGTECGFVNRGNGLINPVSIIRYRVGQICNPNLAGDCTGEAYEPALRSTGPDVVLGESVRADLLREELSPVAGTAANRFDLTLAVATDELSSREIAAEFAVDLDFAAVFETGAALPAITLTRAPFGSTAALNGLPPQRARSLGIRFSTRARVPDRDEDGPAGVKTRFQLTPVGSGMNFARMRTLETEVQLPNLQGVTW